MGKRVLAAMAALLAVLLCACRETPMPRQRTSFALDTLCTVTVYTPADEPVLQEALRRIDDWERLCSRHEPDGPVARLNENGGGHLEAPLLQIVSMAKEVSDLSGGAFDIALGQVSDLWGFGTDHMAVPDAGELEAVLAQSGMAHLNLNGETLTLSDGAILDLGGVAKGYIAQKTAAFLKEKGVQSAIVNLGGNVVLVGMKPDGQDFTVGIQSPLETDGMLIATVSASDCAVVTSGVYQRYFVKDGVRYHHVIDPRTGAPARTDLYSVTVVCADAAYADALSTALLVLGRDAGVALVQTLPDVEAVFVDDELQIVYTPGLDGKVEVLR